MKAALISAGLKRIGKQPLKRLEWAVDFSQRPLTTPAELARAGMELTCFLYTGLQDYPGLPVTKQINAMLTDPHWVDHSFKGEEVTRAQRRFADVLKVAAGESEIEDLPLKHIKVTFTRHNGVEYVSVIPHQSANVRTEAKREAVVFKLLRLLDKKTVKTSLAKSKGGERFTPVRLYVGVCPEAKDGCGKLFARTRIDQEYCCRRCVSRAQVYRFRRIKRALKRLYPGKRLDQLTAPQLARVQRHAESLRESELLQRNGPQQIPSRVS